MWFNSGSGNGNNNTQATGQQQQKNPTAGQQMSTTTCNNNPAADQATSSSSPATNSSNNKTAPSLIIHPTSNVSSNITSGVSGGGGSSNAASGQQQPSFLHSSSPNKISFHLKTSIFTRRVTIESDKMALGFIKQLAISFLNELYFQHQYPANTYIGDYVRKHFSSADNLNSLYDRLVLRKYNCEHETFLPFNSVSDIEPESFISIEVSEKQPTTHNQHLLSGASANISSLHTNTTTTSSTSQHGGQTNVSPHPVAVGSTTTQLKISHEFKPETYLLPTYCASCSIKGMFRQGFHCSFCKKNFCPKCKTKAETSGDGCLALATTNQPLGAIQSSAPNSSSSSSNGNVDNTGNAASINNSTSIANIGSPVTTGSKLDVAHPNMSKRKSASNLLHFNIGNPFKSHHNQPQQPAGQQQTQQQANQSAAVNKEDKAKVRGSAGALDPVLQQLGKRLREQQQQQQQQQQSQNQKPVEPPTNSKKSQYQLEHGGSSRDNLMVAQSTHISSSHHNLFASIGQGSTILTSSEDKGEKLAIEDGGTGGSGGGSSSVTQSPVGSGRVNQLSNSARTSAQDLHAASPTKTNHTFISMDWIQINGEPTCGVCNKVLKSSQQQQQPPFMCKSCQILVHYQCQSLVLADCMSRIAESSRAAANTERQDSNCTTDTNKTAIKNTNSNLSKDNIRLHRLAPSVKHVKRPDSTKPIIEGWLKHTTLSDEQARQHYWRLDETDITLYENDTSTRYFKAIALTKITRVMSAHSLPKNVKEDVLTTGQLIGGCKAKSANTSPAKSPELLAQMNAIFAFQLATGSTFLVQASSESEACRWKESLAAITSKIKQQQSQDQQENQPPHSDELSKEPPVKSGPTVSKLVESSINIEEIRQAVANEAGKVAKQGPPASNDGEKKATEKQEATSGVVEKQPKAPAMGRQHHHHYPPSGHYRGHHKTYTDPNRSRLYNRPRITIQLDPMSIPDHWIEGKYLIERDRVKGVGFMELGSGQFGKVYAAISELKREDPSKGFWSGVPVAIKEISKARFDLRQQAKLKNEANILSRLDHPGVIILERVHDLPDKIYIVMEQLEDDMLEMIVSTEEKRLNERITKFLTYQILEALKYLHAQNIAHCDLKPENVLLVERRSQFPQIKLCDFGFAKIIEENSFRSSLVGTPAYLAPEVVKGERYNRSVDLWSVGVIVYVSLSGEFPFNEGENIHDQISRANFMYPDQPWSKISNRAKNFINSLLRVNCEKRLSANRAQLDEWIQDYQLWCDLSELEVRVGRRWVTDDADFERWSRYAKEHNLQIPRSAIQLHEDLIAD